MKEPSSWQVQIPNFRQYNGSQLCRPEAETLVCWWDLFPRPSHGWRWAPGSVPAWDLGPWPHSQFDSEAVVCRLHLESYWKFIAALDFHSGGSMEHKDPRHPSMEPLYHELVLSALLPSLPISVSITCSLMKPGALVCWPRKQHYQLSQQSSRGPRGERTLAILSTVIRGEECALQRPFPVWLSSQRSYI